MCDEKGEIIDGDQIIAMIAKNWKKKKILKGGVVGTLMTNLNRPAAAYLVFLIINSRIFVGSVISFEIVTEAISAIIVAQSFDRGGFHESPIWLR